MSNPVRSYNFFEGEVLLFDKGSGWTSSDLVQKVRNSLCHALGIKKLKVGHAGTLDPLATGLMVLCTGKSTKKIESIQEGEKEYIATIKLGATTPSFDKETEEDNVFEFKHITAETIQDAVRLFTGQVEQVPPVYSAVKINGKRAYDFARAGEKIKLNPRKVVIESIEIVSFNLPELVIKVVCGKGTYIRALVRDLGKALGSGAYLTALRRARIGSYNVDDAMTIEHFLNNITSFVTN